jgi:hypothetical protein
MKAIYIASQQNARCLQAAVKCEALAYSQLFMMCNRCGLAWPADQAKPDCAPMTFVRMVEAIELEAESHEASHTVVAALKETGMRADPQPPLARAAQLRTVARLVRKLSANDAVLRLLRNG